MSRPHTGGETFVPPAVRATKQAPVFVGLRVAQLRRDTADSVVVRFQTPDERFRFAHGQHLTLRRSFDGTEIRRSYSICSPAPDGPLQVAIKRVDGGVFSTWANSELREGDEIDVMTPTGRFTSDLDPAAARRYVLVSAGSGITPVHSIAATVLAGEPRSQVCLLVVNRTSESIMLLDETEALRSRFLGRVQIWHMLTRERTDVPLLSGRPDRRRLEALAEAGIVPTSADEVFVCGPSGLVAVVREFYEGNGADPGRVHDELFTTPQSGRLDSGARRRVGRTAVTVGSGAVILHGRQSSFAVHDGDTVLDAASRVRPDAPFSCRSGVCSTCRARLVEGEVTMAVEHGLVPGEKEAGYILCCQAIPVSARVLVDFDA